MSSFLLKKSICGKFCFSVSIWRNRLPNRIESLWRSMATMLYRKQRAEISFVGSMTILTWVTRSVKIGPGIAKNACRAIGCFSNSHFHAATCHGEGSKDRKMCRMNWTIGRWSDAKTHAKFCLPDKKESRSCIGLAMKSGSIFIILNARNFGLIPSNHQHLPEDQITSDGRWCCAFGGIRSVIYYELLKLLMLTATTNNWSNCTVLCVKKGHIIGKDMTSWFSFAITHHRKCQQEPHSMEHLYSYCYNGTSVTRRWFRLEQHYNTGRGTSLQEEIDFRDYSSGDRPADGYGGASQCLPPDHRAKAWVVVTSSQCRSYAVISLSDVFIID